MLLTFLIKFVHNKYSVKECSVCYENTDNYLVCKHAVCEECKRRMYKCPMCRRFYGHDNNRRVFDNLLILDKSNPSYCFPIMYFLNTIMLVLSFQNFSTKSDKMISCFFVLLSLEMFATIILSYYNFIVKKLLLMYVFLVFSTYISLLYICGIYREDELLLCKLTMYFYSVSVTLFLYSIYLIIALSI